MCCFCGCLFWCDEVGGESAMWYAYSKKEGECFARSVMAKLPERGKLEMFCKE